MLMTTPPQKCTICHILFLFLIVLSVKTAAEVPPATNWPLKNGDFRFLRHPGANRPTYWNQAIQSGSYSFGRELMAEGDYAVSITSISSGQAMIWQTVDFLPGQYTLTADVYGTSGSTVKIASPGTAGITINGTGGWQRADYEFTATGSGAVYLILIGSGTAKFRNVSVTIRSLSSGSVSFVDSTMLGQIEIAESPSPAEAYAAYELQRYIYLMTGTAPGLNGRDEGHPGRSVRVGFTTAPASVQAHLSTFRPDSYFIGVDGQDVILAGNTETGTLYAVYDFLKLQGCNWFAPTPAGRVVQQRTSLLLPGSSRYEQPDYLVRGMFLSSQEFYSSGTWLYVNFEDYFDWAVWNRINCIIFGYGQTDDFGAHRGRGHQQTVNHSWAKYLNDDHPEWWPLVDGVRTKLHSSGRPNQLSVSSQSLRDYVVNDVINYFNQNPSSVIYALNPNDEPCCWCESPGDRSLDSDYGLGAWVKRSDCFPALSMSDRSVHFANEIGSRVAQVHPGKRIELYSYASTANPPIRWPVDPTVMIKITYWPGAPNNMPILDRSNPFNNSHIERMNGWIAAGAQDMGLYDYSLLRRPDSANFNYYHQTDYLKAFNSEWGIRHCTLENGAVLPSLMWNLLRARSYWNVNINYLDEMRQICDAFYGPAADSMFDYYVYMDWASRQYDLWAEFQQANIPAVMAAGRILLEKASADATGNPLVLERVAYARFGHAVATTGICKLTGPTFESRREISKAYYLAKTLYNQYDTIMLSKATDAVIGSLWFYPYGYIWNRSLDWTPGINPDDGQWGEMAWKYQYAARGNRLGEDSPWYTKSLSDMIWREPGWKQNAFSSAPIIYQNYIHQQIGAGYNPFIKWINSTNRQQELNIHGTLTFRWLALCDVTNVDFVVTHRHALTGQTDVLHAETVVKPTPAKLSVNEQVALNLQISDLIVEKEDEIMITMQLTTNVGSGVVQIIDEGLDIELFEYQPKYCGDRNTVYSIADISGPNNHSDCIVDFYDFVALALDWLKCNDLQ